MAKGGKTRRTSAIASTGSARGEAVVLWGSDRPDGRAYQIKRTAPHVFTSDRQDRFFDILSETSNVKLACEVVGISQTAVYHHRRTNAAFAARWQRALADAIADLRMRVAAQGRFGQTTETIISMTDQGERVVRTTRDIAPVALRTLAAAGGEADVSDREDQLERERDEREMRLAAAERILISALQSARGKRHDAAVE